MNKDYTITIFWSKEDEAYMAVVQELEGCSAFGSTPEEALKEVQIAMEAWLEVAREKGDPIPKPLPQKIAVY